MPELQDLVEGLIFLSGEQGLNFMEMLRMLKVDPDQLHAVLEHLLEKYSQGGFHLYRFGETFKFLSDPGLKESFTRAVVQPRNKNLSQASLEILSIIAYKQPISRLEIQKIRGVNCDSTIKTLLNLNLIELSPSESGRAYQYQTTDSFLEYMGMESLEDLPEIQVPDEAETAKEKQPNENMQTET